MGEDHDKNQCPSCGKVIIRCDDCFEPMKYDSTNKIEEGQAVYYRCTNEDCSVTRKRIARDPKNSS